MKKKLLVYFMLGSVLLASVSSSCSKKEESPEPAKKGTPNTPNNPPPPPPPPPGTDTTALFTDKAWKTKKLVRDGVEQVAHFLIGSSYKFNNNTAKDYFFSIPGFPSASGTWVFNASTKSLVEVTNQGGTQTWKLLSISTTLMSVETSTSNGVWVIDYEH